MRKVAIALLVFAPLGTACGDDDSAATATTTHADGGGGATGGTGGTGGTGVETFAFDFVLYDADGEAPDLKGPPLADALVAIDLPSGERQELTTDADGVVHIEVPADVEYLTWTLAKAGHLPVRTFYRHTIAEVQALQAQQGELFTLMAEQPAPVDPATVDITLTADVPFCASEAWGTWCTDGAAQVRSVRQSSEPFALAAYSIDEQDCPVEFREVLLADTLTAQTIALVFDGSNPAVPESFDVTVALPAEPTSLLNTDGLLIENSFPFFVTDSAWRVRGGSCAEQVDIVSGTVDMTVSYFPKEGEDLIFYLLLFVEGHGGDGWRDPSSQHYFGFDNPGPGTYLGLDIPVISSPEGSPERSSTFAWQPIEGATRYVLSVDRLADTYVALWTAESRHHQEVVLPTLPTGYDPAPDWAEEFGYFRVWACDGDGLNSIGAPADPQSLAIEWNCGISENKRGRILP